VGLNIMGTETLIIMGAVSLYQGIAANAEGAAKARMLKSQAELLRIENNAAAGRYEREAKGFKAEQSVQFLKSGVKLTGSPLDILDETSRIASENVSAIRASGEAGATSLEMQAVNAAATGRRALIGGFANAASAGLQMGLYGQGTGAVNTGFNNQVQGDYD